MHTPETRAREMEKRSTLRIAWFSTHGPCFECGTWANLELHHVDPSTKVDHKVWSWSPERREAELAKCVACCHTCHKEITEILLRVGHGHIATYQRGCRCDLCKAVKSLENKHRVRHREGSAVACDAM
jgi:hypothetical protein